MSVNYFGLLFFFSHFGIYLVLYSIAVFSAIGTKFVVVWVGIPARRKDISELLSVRLEDSQSPFHQLLTPAGLRGNVSGC